MQQLLVEQRAFDGSFASAKQRNEIFEADTGWLGARTFKRAVANFEPAEPAWVDKAQFPARLEPGHQVRVRQQL